MAGVKKSDIPNESEMMGMLWNLIKDFYIPEDTEAYWEEFRQRSLEIDQKCNSKLGRTLINGVADFLDQKWKEQYQKHD